MFKCLCHKMNLKMRVGENGLQVPKNWPAETPPQHGRRVSHSRPPREWVNNHVRTANHTPWNQQVCPGRGSSIQQGALGRVNLFPPRPYLTGAKPQQAPDPAMHTHTQTHGPDCHGQRSDHPHNVWVLTSKIRL